MVENTGKKISLPGGFVGATGGRPRLPA